MAEESLVQGDRRFGPEEIAQICLTVDLLPGLARHELASTLCEHLDWMTPSGRPKVCACLKLLDKLAAQGRVRLPAKRAQRPHAKVFRRSYSPGSEPQPLLSVALSEIGELGLEVVSGRERLQLWNEYVDRYHYLGYRRPFGCTLRYFVVSERGLLGCVLLAGAAKALAVRDRWIGWSASQRSKHLPWVVNNTRFLIFPWVRIPHLASHVLGHLARRVGQDWFQCWGYRPVLLESFVDAQRFRGTCYRAAGWIELGSTSGRGFARPGRVYTSTPKRIYVRPLVKDFRVQLCSGPCEPRSQR